jgi:hypothetical protein
MDLFNPKYMNFAWQGTAPQSEKLTNNIKLQTVLRKQSLSEFFFSLQDINLNTANEEDLQLFSLYKTDFT